MQFPRRFAAALVLSSVVGALAGGADAPAFLAWTVNNVRWADGSDVGSHATQDMQRQAARPNGALLGTI